MDELIKYEEIYEDILDKIMDEFRNDFIEYGNKNLTVIDKEELTKVIVNKEFYFADSLDLGYRRDRLVGLLLSARRAYERKEEIRKKIPSERKKDYQEIMTKEEYNINYENKKKKKRVYKLKKVAIVAGLITALSLGTVIEASVQKHKNFDLSNNVCVEYTVQQGDTYKDIESLGLKDYGISHYETKGPYRDSNIIYAGDKFIGRTTEEQAKKLVEEGSTKIVTVDYAEEKLGENHTKVGEFEKYENGESKIEFDNSGGKSL